MQYNYYFTSCQDHPELTTVVFVDGINEYALTLPTLEATDFVIQGSFVDYLYRAKHSAPKSIATKFDRIEAQALYTAMMTDTLLDEEAE